ncbi:MAG: 2-oxoacid:acceptor oxidoreductase family protein [Planctomycetota bacterium]|jgi:indolepyruvate ferredoxin oxidoreductase beta subunit|nr:2-oxoacid:acceptor oxidoreductase family protein [Planctomycetota bacterium]
MKNTSILIVGVGGQGVIRSSMILGTAGDDAGLQVRMGQLHGMSQRGGSVESTVLLGAHRTSFLPERGADIILALEPLELLRTISNVHDKTRVIVSTGTITPTLIATTSNVYPDRQAILDKVAARCAAVVRFDGPEALANANCPLRSLNSLALGILAAQNWLPFDAEQLEMALEKHSFGPHGENNQRAFQTGRSTVLS